MHPIDKYIRTIPDFPEKGIMFRDVTSVLQDADGLHLAIDELMKVGDQCYADMMEFQEKYEKEMMAIENTLTEKQMQEYEKKIEKALTEFEAAINKKSNQLMEEYDIDY